MLGPNPEQLKEMEDRLADMRKHLSEFKNTFKGAPDEFIFFVQDCMDINGSLECWCREQREAMMFGIKRTI